MNSTVFSVNISTNVNAFIITFNITLNVNHAILNSALIRRGSIFANISYYVYFSADASFWDSDVTGDTFLNGNISTDTSILNSNISNTAFYNDISLISVLIDSVRYYIICLNVSLYTNWKMNVTVY